MPNLVTVAQCWTEVEAELLRSRIERAGIRCHLANQQIRGASGGAMTGYHAVYVWVQVAEGDVERARQIVAAPAPELSDDEEQDLDALAEAAGHCPVCGSEEVAFEETFAGGSVKGRCLACRHHWLLE